MNKTLYLIRHGYSLHNELFHKLGVKAFRMKETIDSPLTFLGEQQSIELVTMSIQSTYLFRFEWDFFNLS